MAQGRPLALLVLLAVSLAGLAVADDGAPDGAPNGAPNGAPDGPAAPPPPPEIVDEFDAAVITGDRVNLRVGPRIDNRAVSQLVEGTVVLVVEQRGDWFGVRVPKGFPAAVSLDFVTREGPDVLRVATRNLNLRVMPPEPKQSPPGIFLDHPAKGVLLTLIDIADPPAEGELPPGLKAKGWAWVVAPESTRAFVHSRYVKRLGRASEHAQLVRAARAERVVAAAQLTQARRTAAAREAGLRLMKVVGTVQHDLHRLRHSAGTDKAPVVALANRLDEALQREVGAADNFLRLGRALREDLEREITLRVARHDAELAKQRGVNPPAVPPLEPVVEDFRQLGEIRYEPTPGWQEEGVYFLWADGRPRYVLRLTTGGPLPHPELKTHAGGGRREVRGRLPGKRLFGLPVCEVKTVGMPPKPN